MESLRWADYIDSSEAACTSNLAGNICCSRSYPCHLTIRVYRCYGRVTGSIGTKGCNATAVDRRTDNDGSASDDLGKPCGNPDNRCCVIRLESDIVMPRDVAVISNDLGKRTVDIG